MKYRVLIPTAGIGSRLAEETKYINKSLVTVNNQPIISHIINKFPISTEFVIALGYKGDLVKQYLKIAHPKNKFIFVKIGNYIGRGSGLGLTLHECKKFLQLPFIFFSCDTYVLDQKISLPNMNWIGYSKSYNPKLYRTIKIKKKKLVKIYNKNFTGGNYDYIGLAGINDYKEFWRHINKNKNVINNGEIVGLNHILHKKIYTHKFKWFDCGNTKTLNALRDKLYKNGQPNILPKKDEFISFVKDQVIKFHADKNFIKKRVSRQNILKNFTPKIEKFSKNFYSYKKVKGFIFSKKNNRYNFQRLITHLEKFWVKKELNSNKKFLFYKNCLNFYKSKTLMRLNKFYIKDNLKDNNIIINNNKVPNIKSIFKKIDWKQISKGVPVNFHGDLHFENILISSKKIKLLDWRQDFSGNIFFGDIYYDFAKLLHGMIVSHEIVKNNGYNVKINRSKVILNIKKNKKNIESINLFFKWLLLNGYNIKKVKIICGLIYLNIAALHHNPYSIFLFYLGKLVIFNAISNKRKIL
mgnify:CR=1 FL=1